MFNRYIVLDVETTGNAAKKGDRIIQIAAVLIEDKQIIRRFSSYVNPEVEIPSFIENLTGINNNMVKDAPKFEEIAGEIWKMLEGTCFVAHNVPFDLSFLNEELLRCGYNIFKGPTLDTVELSRLLFPTLDGYKLFNLSEYLNLAHENPHRADSDANVTAELLFLILEKLENLPLYTLEKLLPLVRYFQCDIEIVINELVQSKMMKIDENIDLDYYRKLVLKMQEELSTGTSYGNKFPTVNDLTSNLQEIIENYETREEQLQMMQVVDEAFKTKTHSLIEAGTGVGKSLGYLIPAVIQAKQTGRPVVISTHTVQLQQQLLERDIPILEKIFSSSINASIIKGRNHYLCLRKYEQYLSSIQENTYDEIFTKAQILVWLVETEFGDVEELNLPSGGNILWSSINSDTNSCLNQKCPWFSRCFYHRSKRRAERADLIITNHSLLFADIQSESLLLPSYQEVVIDKAHHIEEIASKHFGKKTDYYSFIRIFDKIGVIDNQEDSNLKRLSKLLMDYQAEEVAAEQFQLMNDKLKTTRMEIDELFRLVKSYLVAYVNNSSGSNKITYRYTLETVPIDLYEQLKEMLDRINFNVEEVVHQFTKWLDKLSKERDMMSTYQKGLLVDFRGFINAMETETSVLSEILKNRSEDVVCWIEIDTKGPVNSAYLYSQPVEIGEKLADTFFQKKNSVVMTSATLTIKNSFAYILETIGLEESEVQAITIPSPFNYNEQAKLIIPTDIPMIKEVKERQYIDHISDVIEKTVKVTNGKMLVLFTNNEMLKTTYSIVKDRLSTNVKLIGQGIDSGSRYKLTKRFKQYDHAILFGTNSFWEGVDIPGADLSCIIIVRLPFTPPNDPVLEAKTTMLKNSGRNAFMELSLPQAIIRFKQGFGRLIRTKEDRGVVMVLDQRIIKTRYGKLFISSLPDIEVIKDDLDSILKHLKNWID